MNMKEALRLAAKKIEEMPAEELAAKISKYTKEECEQYAELERSVCLHGELYHLREENARLRNLVKRFLDMWSADEVSVSEVQRLRSDCEKELGVQG